MSNYGRDLCEPVCVSMYTYVLVIASWNRHQWAAAALLQQIGVGGLAGVLSALDGASV